MDGNGEKHPDYDLFVAVLNSTTAAAGLPAPPANAILAQQLAALPTDAALGVATEIVKHLSQIGHRSMPPTATSGTTAIALQLLGHCQEVYLQTAAELLARVLNQLVIQQREGDALIDLLSGGAGLPEHAVRRLHQDRLKGRQDALRLLGILADHRVFPATPITPPPDPPEVALQQRLAQAHAHAHHLPSGTVLPDGPRINVIHATIPHEQMQLVRQQVGANAGRQGVYNPAFQGAAGPPPSQGPVPRMQPPMAWPVAAGTRRTVRVRRGEMGVDPITDAHRINQRQKQINLGRMTEGFKNYMRLIEMGVQIPEHMECTVPNPSQRCSKRAWDAMVRSWRRTLHSFDDPALMDMMTSEQFHALKERAQTDAWSKLPVLTGKSRKPLAAGAAPASGSASPVDDELGEDLGDDMDDDEEFEEMEEEGSEPENGNADDAAPSV
eukprot:TRINITY_DN15960_c0_g1_i1.p2 TRINITY_DN15960_c0_g1~~TRINITY_DN15960_c0_g1_i1.p2  ORF type:complete len:440 (+),score=116.20 TRINITY_DN15960_c0_g1_i1:145-1464(+)